MDILSLAKSFVSNPDLKTVKPDWRGNPLDENGRFLNHLQPMMMTWKDVWKWQTSEKPFAKEKKNQVCPVEVRNADSFLKSKEDGFVWLGHSTFLFRCQGITLITDPLFGSPSLFMKRYSEFPLDLTLLNNIDVLLLSHDHRDHMDKPSLKRIYHQNPNIITYTGLKMSSLLTSFGAKSENIIEAGWYQQYAHSEAIDNKIKITYVPSRHWCRRWLFDTNVRLWGGFMIQFESKTVFFGGDSGYGPHFKEIKEVFPQIDIAILGIGAYKPEWFMGPSHTSPTEAAQAFFDVGAKRMIPMHYATFDLADEPIGMPLDEIRHIAHSQNQVITPTHIGEIVNF
ncbi:MAG: MBL fold metallo-hydrolase [Leadbetterella sp.]